MKGDGLDTDDAEAPSPVSSSYSGLDRPRSKRQKADNALPFQVFDDIVTNGKKPHIIKGVIVRGETSSWVGAPGKAKSALITDISVHVSAGWGWRGYKTKEQCSVVILAFERVGLLQRRLDAYRRKYGLKGLPIAIVKAPVDLMNSASVEILTNTIRRVEARFSLSVGMLVLDTFAKAIAYGGGDENSAKDQNRVLGNLRLVQDETNIHIALVGHTGKDEARGARGSSAHLGDVDLMVQISGDLVKSAVITKANDQPEGSLTTFKLETFEFGVDEDDDPITTSIVSADVPDQAPKSEVRYARSDRQQIALDSLTEVIIAFGVEPPASLQLPKRFRVVDVGKWREEMFRRGVLDKQASNPRRDFIKVRDALVTQRLIGLRDNLVWKVETS
ncbi:MAG TPA: AAA family ATPase [Microvirga sp.]|nr:AAA family ATPase [Microvirga sp.]